MSRPRRRERGARGAGSVYRIERKRKTGPPRVLWVAAVTFRDATTKRLRRVVAYATSQEAASAKLQALYRSPAVASKIGPQRGSLAEFLDRWFAAGAPSGHKKNPRELRASTLATYEATRDAHILPYPLARKELARLTPFDFEADDQALKKAGASGRTRLKAHDLLNAALSRAVVWKALPTNPVERGAAGL